jgi:hypothetical protein
MVPSTSDNTSKRQSDQGVDQYDNYYAVNTEYKKPNTNSAIAAIHNTPLKTSANKIFEVKKRDYSASRSYANFKPISSIKNACYTVTRSQRKRRYNGQSIITNRNEDVNTASMVYEFGSATPNKPLFTPNMKSKVYNKPYNPTQLLYKKAAIKKQSSKNMSDMCSTPTKISTNNHSNVNDFSFENIDSETTAVPEPAKTSGTNKNSWTINIFSKLKNLIIKEPTIFP